MVCEGFRVLTKIKKYENVLILVLVEDGLRVLDMAKRDFLISQGLNPCFSGRWSARGKFATRRFADL